MHEQYQELLWPENNLPRVWSLKRRQSMSIPNICAHGWRPCQSCTGVYQFHGESETLPLYIGKSVNIRSRVLSHLRTADEASMLRRATHQLATHRR